MFDLLTEGLIRADLVSGERVLLSLPEVYEAMMADDVAGFPALRPHQRHAWHAFLAQLGAVGVYQLSREGPPRGAAHWQHLLEELTPDSPKETSWSLIVDDPTVPAFMQCPAPDGWASYRKELLAADDLDLLVTAKNHDVKSSMAVAGEADDWIFSLVSLQTMSGFGGAGNYGVARMNGGFSSRPCLGLAPANGGPGAHLKHDIRRLLEHREAILESYEDYFDADSGLALLWTQPWDGTSSLTLSELDPHFIEICRRVRLIWRDGRILAGTATSKKARIAAKYARGNVGDHWTPVVRGDEKALSVSGVGFRYDRLAELVLDESKYHRPPAMVVDATPGRSWRLVARGIAAGQGKTEGYHERVDIVLRPKVARSLMGVGEAREELGELSRTQLMEIQAVAKALRLAIAIAASGGQDASALGASDREKAYPYLRRFDATVDVQFFRALQERFEAAEDDRPAARREFVRLLVTRAKSLLAEAVETVPCARIQRFRARTRATSAFWGSLWRSDVIDLAILHNTHEEEQHVS
ncbi:MAG: type I-E CRISPR-associated protein Cse1/CasA [Gemmatimonadota bacterium]|nr:type I-E CRISPR-associated protein Cse1/CasA [Gemmatimonadota bacterium]MDE2983747.1 type I-E CRISPR-associated protein Cse1/CasA [Gemmatimonadota bacterium]